MSDGHIHISAGDTICAQYGPDGALWIATRENGILRIQENKSLFHRLASGVIRSLYTDNGRQFYIGLGMEGVAWFDTVTGQMRKGNLVPGYDALPKEGFSTRVTSIVRRHNGELWMAAGDNGILISRPNGKCTILYGNSRQMPYVKDNVTALYESHRDHTLWIGQRQGVSILTKNGKGQHLDIKTADFDLTGYLIVNHITEDHKGRIWISSTGSGIIRIDGWTGSIRKLSDLQYHRYTTPTTNITACFEDSRHQIWAITAVGLLKYHPTKDCFETVGEHVQMVGKKVLAINEDKYGTLWITTDQALVRIDEHDKGTITCFTEQEGLPSTSFIPNATFSYNGWLFFGTSNGIASFQPKPSYHSTNGYKPNLVVTDIFIDGTSIRTLDSLSAAHISIQQPMLTHDITIPSAVKRWGVEFALLTYSKQHLVQYAYRLEGIDRNLLMSHFLNTVSRYQASTTSSP